jgi:hypothetical protein
LRLPVVASFLVHGAVIALAARLPVVSDRQTSRPIEVDVRTPLTPPEPPKPPEPEPPKPEPPKPEKVAMRAPMVREPTVRKKEEVEPPPPEAPPKPEPQVTGPPSNKPPGKVDLTLHALPGSTGGEYSVSLPAGEPGGTFGVPAKPAPRKEWRPRGDAGDPITGKVRDVTTEEFPLKKVGRDEYVYKGPSFSAHITPDGKVSFDDKYIRDFNGTSGTFDLNDIFMRGKKEDPYRHLKKKFMDQTEKLRTGLVKRAHDEQVAQAIAGLPQHLAYVWSDRRKSVKSRKDMLYAIWKDTAGPGDEDSKAGEEARRVIEDFVRRQLPPGSDECYTEEELEVYNRGRSLKFAPYR